MGCNSVLQADYLHSYKQYCLSTLTWSAARCKRTINWIPVRQTTQTSINKELCHKASEKVLKQNYQNFLRCERQRPRYYVCLPYHETINLESGYQEHHRQNASHTPCSRIPGFIPQQEYVVPTEASRRGYKEVLSYLNLSERTATEVNGRELCKDVQCVNFCRPLSRCRLNNCLMMSQRMNKALPLKDFALNDHLGVKEVKHELFQREQNTFFQACDSPSADDTMQPKIFPQKLQIELNGSRNIEKKTSSTLIQRNDLFLFGTRKQDIAKENFITTEKNFGSFSPIVDHASRLSYFANDKPEPVLKHARCRRKKHSVEVSQNFKLSNSFSDKYSMDEIIGVGGGGVVYSGIRITDKLPVAIKQLKREKIKRWEKTHGKAIPQEIALMTRVSSFPGVVTLLEWFEFSDSFMLVLEKPKNSVDLFDFIREVGKIWEKDACLIFKQIIHAVQYIHSRGVFHRDIKDENIILNRGTLEAKIIDFGCGTFLLHDHNYKDFAGTPEFYPPEWFKQHHYKADSATVWSLGVLLFDMVCGELPFKSRKKVVEAKLEFKGQLSAEVKHLLTWMMNKDREMRPSLSQVLLHPWFNG